MATLAGTSKGGSKRKASSSSTNITIMAGDADHHRETSVESSSSPSKKKKRANNGHHQQHQRTVKKEVDDDNDDNDDDEEQAVLSEKGQTKVTEWNTDDLSMLIHNIEAQLPKPDKGKYSTQVLKVDWEKVCFTGHGPYECKAKWTEIMTKVRRFRTLTELVEDAKEWMKQPWTAFSMTKKGKHPDLPKKPLTPYFRFFMEKRKRLSQERPELSMTELAKMLAKKYAEMPEKKKQKYKDFYERENENYKVQISKFKMEHPDLYPEGDAPTKSGRGTKQTMGGPPKPQTAVQLFMTEKMTKHTNLDPAEKKEYEEKYRAQWKNLSNAKRVKWIRKAVVTEQQYTVELAQFCLEKPDYKVDNVKSVITKAEKAILDRFDGKPNKPPNSGYSLYSKIMLKEITDIPSKEKMAEISRRWKELSEKERQSYGKQVIDATEKYNRDFAKYLEGLPEEDRKKLLEASKPSKKKASPKGGGGGGGGGGSSRGNNEDVSKDAKVRGQSKPKKPLSALFLYQQEKMPAYREKHPDKSEQEVTRHLAREFGELSDKKKDKYKRLAEEARKENAAAQVKSEVWKGKLFKGEPKKPPQSGYLLFTTELISKLVTVEPKGRMAEISRRWKTLSVIEQEKYKKKAAELTKKYNKEHLKFLESLSLEDRQLYAQQKVKKGGGGVTAKPNSPIKPMKVEVVVDNDASSDDDAGDDKDDSESGSDSKSDDDSDDDDDSDKSGSESESGDSNSSNSNSSSTDSPGSSASSSESGSDSDSDSGSEK